MPQNNNTFYPNHNNKFLEKALENVLKLQFDSENNLKVRTQTVKAAIWDTITDFDKGTHTDTEASGTGENQILRPADLVNLDDHFPFTTAGNYTLSDGAKLEITGGKVQHKAVSGNTQTSPFTTPGNYTISDSDKLEITGGVAKLKDSGDSYPTNVLGHWKLNESSGPSAADSTGNGHTGTLVNMEDGDWVAGKLNNGLIFDSAGNEYINAGTSTDFEFETTDAFSVEFWLKTTETASNAFLISRNQASSPNRGWTITLGNTGTGLVAFVMKDDNDDFIKRIGDTNIADDAWHHVLVTYDGSANRSGINIYIDGALETIADAGVASLSGSTAIGGGEFLAFMASNGLGGVNFCAGTLDNVLVYGSELTASQVTARYNSGTGVESLYDIEAPNVIRSTGMLFTAALSSFTETATKPTDTSVKYHVSSDDGTTWKYWTGSAWAAIPTTSTEFQASAISTSVGTVDAGDLASIQTLDASTYDISEVAGSPGFRTEIEYNNVAGPPDQVTLHMGYDGNLGHTVNVEIWNYVTEAWDNLGTAAETGGSITQQNYTVTGTKANYLSGGVVKVRINHASSGNTNHDFHIDYTYVLATPNNLGLANYYANTASEVNTNIASLASSGTFKFRAYLVSDTGFSTPELDQIVVSEPVTYSTTDDLYVESKDAAQIDLSDVVAFLSLINTVTNPANTDIRLLFSNDGRSSWLTWSGSAWVAPASATTRTDATTLADAEANIASLPVGTNDTLDVRVFLYTSDSSTQAAVDNINVTADKSFMINTSWESNIFDSGVHEQDWGKISFEVTLPSGTSVTIKAKASSLSAVDLSGVAWSSALSNNEETNLVGRYMQVQVTFVATATERPTMDSVRLQYVTPDIQLVLP